MGDGSRGYVGFGFVRMDVRRDTNSSSTSLGESLMYRRIVAACRQSTATCLFLVVRTVCTSAS